MSSEWECPLKIPPLSFEGVQIWRLEPGVASASHSFSRLLSPDEKRRADAIRILKVRAEFVAGRGLLRLLLGAAAGIAPNAIVLGTMQNGKPCLAPGTNVEFNVSHSDGMILIALSRASEVGVDVEFVSGEFGEAEELIGIARESFHADEIAEIARTPPGRERLLAFYRAWTRREAVAKADGRGIASVLKYEVFRADDIGERRVSLAGLTGSVEVGRSVDYFVQTPKPGPHHLAAIASRRPRQALALYDAGRLLT